MPHSQAPRERLLALLVRAAALWILTGAFYKLFWGSPVDLPTTVRELSQAAGLGPGMTLRLAIAIEASIAGLALLRPRAAWWLVALQLAVFIAVLVPMILAGAESCGCFGSRVKIPPSAMAAIDGGLLAGILLTTPWRLARSAVPLGLALPVLLAAWSAPWIVMGFNDTGLVAPPAGAADGASWKLPEELPRYVTFEPHAWVGKPLANTDLGALMDVRAYPADADWILYSVTCDHCAAYLRELAGGFHQDPKLYVFVRLSQPNEEASRQVQPDQMPPGEEAILPVDVIYDITPPWHLRLEAGVVAEVVKAGR